MSGNALCLELKGIGKNRLRLKLSWTCIGKLNLILKLKNTVILLNIDKYEKSFLSQLRYGILPLRIETGRFCNEKREERICVNCDTNNVETVEHFLFECPMYDTQRLQFINSVQNSIDNWDNITYEECLKQLFEVKPRALGKYVKEIFLYRRGKLYK